MGAEIGLCAILLGCRGHACIPVADSRQAPELALGFVTASHLLGRRSGIYLAFGLVSRVLWVAT